MPSRNRHKYIKESALRSPTNFKKGIFTKTMYKLINFCLIDKKGRFYYIKYQIFILKPFLNGLQFFFENIPFFKFVGLRKALSLI